MTEFNFSPAENVDTSVTRKRAEHVAIANAIVDAAVAYIDAGNESAEIAVPAAIVERAAHLSNAGSLAEIEVRKVRSPFYRRVRDEFDSRVSVKVTFSEEKETFFVAFFV